MISQLIKDKKYTYKLALCKMNYEYIMPLEYTRMSFTRKFNDYDELSVSIPKKISVRNASGKRTINYPAWGKITSGTIILMRIYDGDVNIYNEYFTVSDHALSTDHSEKDISCIAAHQSLFNRLTLTGYEQVRKLYQYDGEYYNGISFDLSDNTGGGIINYIVEYKLTNKNYLNDNEHWKVSYYDESLNTAFDSDSVTSEDLENLRNNIASYWHISRRQEDLDSYTGNVPTTWDDGSKKFTVRSWQQKFLDLLKNDDNTDVDTTGTLTDLYLNRLYLQNTINKIGELIDDSIDKLYILSSYEKIKKDTYIGTKLLTAAEETVVQLQGFIDAILTENNASESEITDYIEECMLLFKDITENLVTPLLIFKGCSGVPPYRYLSLDGVNLTDAFEQISEAYNCFFVFDNYKREIKIYNRTSTDMNEHNSILISDKTLASRLQRQDNHDQIITRLYLTGKNDSVISGITHNGERYWDDFSYFMDEDHMSEELISAINALNQQINSYKGDSGKDLYGTLIEYDQKYNGKIDDFMYLYGYYVKYVYASSEYEDIGKKLNKAISKGDTAEIEVLREEQSTMAKAIGSYIAVLNGTLTWETEHWCGTDYASQHATVDLYDGTSPTGLDGGAYADKMKKFFDNCYYILDQKYSLQNKFKYDSAVYENGERIFSDVLIAELNNFIFEANETVDTVSDNRALLYYAKNYIKYINTIPTTIDISLIDILSNKNYQSMWGRLNKVGDLIMIDYSPFGLNKEYFRLISYTHDPLSGSLEMNFSNAYELKNIYRMFLNGVVKTALDLSRSADKYQDSWDEYLQKKELYLQEGQDIDASINSIRSNGKLIVGKDGVTLSKQTGNTIKQYADGLYCSGNSDTSVEDSIFNSETGLSADLTVNSVKTDFKRAYRYLMHDTSNLNYEYLYDEKFLFISDVLKSSEPIQLTGADGTKMYWKEDPSSWRGGITFKNIREQMTSSVTNYPVEVYQYDSYIKGSWAFELETLSDGSTNEIPVITMGVGDAAGHGKATLKKSNDGLIIKYTSRGDTATDIAAGTEFEIKFKDSGIYQQIGNTEYKMRPIKTTNQIPTSGYEKDVFYFYSPYLT